MKYLDLIFITLSGKRFFIKENLFGFPEMIKRKGTDDQEVG